ncbi:unnamed protein product [Hermetia illucens]|uniref:HMG box domain-containing protein n=1 Tax=Hermetia illucens TaxID=343691 RepID=A0A7R8UPZ4_HERIL|nr:uncharacterized protein LOC119651890 [Hermetia illucens]CAD7084882.1 unnamed protein product [Hermetia illucens]
MGDTASVHSRDKHGSDYRGSKDGRRVYYRGRRKKSKSGGKRPKIQHLKKTACSCVKNKVMKSESLSGIVESYSKSSGITAQNKGSFGSIHKSSSDLKQDPSVYDIHKIDTADALRAGRCQPQGYGIIKREHIGAMCPAGSVDLEYLSQNPFFNYLRELRKKHASLAMKELSKKGGQNWRAMSHEEKFPYIIMAQKYREYRLKRLQSGATPVKEESSVESVKQFKAPVVSRKSGKANTKKKQFRNSSYVS